MGWSRYRGRRYASHGRNTHTYTTGPKSPPGSGRDWVAKVDRNPHYRSHDIMCGAYKKEVRLKETKGASYTDGEEIGLKFNQHIDRKVIEDAGKWDEHTHYRLECGHLQEFTNEFQIGDVLPCHVCGGYQSYLVLMHEWSHIIFHSFLVAMKDFCDELAKEYSKLCPHLLEMQLSNFFFLLCNAFDDMRCTSLLGLVYPGSEAGLMERWVRLTGEYGYTRTDTDFVAYVLTVAVGTDTNPTGPFAGTKPVVEWGMDRVRGKGLATMLGIVRVVVDRSISAIIDQLPPPPPPSPQSQASPTPAPPSHIPPLNQSSQGKKDEARNTLINMVTFARPTDPDESHPTPSPEQMRDNPNKQTAKAIVRAAMGLDVGNPGAVQQVDQACQGPMDQSIQASLNLLQNNLADKSKDSELMADARARIFFIDVAPKDIEESKYVELESQERWVVNSLRSSFYRALGQLKAARGPEGLEIDIQAAIQYMIESGMDDDYGVGNTTDLFKRVAAQQGFAYHIVVDMSGSMISSFHHVAKAARMLEEALDFPFVTGKLWGFRGAEDVLNKEAEAGEVWLYRYHPDCLGYEGRTKVRVEGHLTEFPVECGGITPMNSALRVSARHMISQVPAGMAKRLFLITDGSPYQFKNTGKKLPISLLRQWVREAIMLARSKGVQVFTLIINGGISDDEALRMFGSRRFWRQVSSYQGADCVGQALFNLVRDNFTRYLRLHT
jgi:hypothetical protein